MKELLAIYEKARFEKAAQPPVVAPPEQPAPPAQPTSPLQGQQMNPSMRAVRDAIEQSIRREHRSRQEALEAAQWARGELMDPSESWLSSAGKAVSGTTALAGAGAGAEHALSKYAPKVSTIEQAIARHSPGELQELIGRNLVQSSGKKLPASEISRVMGAGDPQLAHSLLSESRAMKYMPPGRRVDPAAAKSVLAPGAKGPPGAVTPYTAPGRGPLTQGWGAGAVGRKPGAEGVPSEFAKALRHKIGGKTGRQRLHSKLMVSKPAKGRWASSPTLRGALKGVGVASLFAIVPWLIGKLKSVPSDVSESQQYATKRLQLADALRKWREAQFESLSGAQGPEGVTALPFAPYAEGLS